MPFKLSTQIEGTLMKSRKKLSHNLVIGAVREFRQGISFDCQKGAIKLINFNTNLKKLGLHSHIKI